MRSFDRLTAVGASGGWAGLVLLLCLALTPTEAAAETFHVCVSVAGEMTQDPPTDCVDGSAASIADALDQALAQPWLPGDSVELQVAGGPADPPLVEALSLDLRGVDLDISLLFNRRLLCAPPDLRAGAPLIDFIGGRVYLNKLHVDLGPAGPCPSERSVLLSVETVVDVVEADLSGWTGWAIGSGLIGAPGPMFVGHSSLRNGTGAAITTSGGLAAVAVEFSGIHIPAGTFAPAIIQGGGDEDGLQLSASMFFGNQLDAGTAAVLGPVAQLRDVSFVANGLGDGALLVHTGYRSFQTQLGEPTPPQEAEGITQCVFSRNRHVSLPSDFSLPAFAASGGFSDVTSLGSTQCVAEFASPPFSERPSPFASDSLSGGEGPLLDIDPSQGYPSDGGLLIAKSFFTENDTGGAPLITARLPSRMSLQLIHDTFGGNGGASLLRVSAAGSSAELVAVRNLLADEGTRAFALDEVPGRLTISQNAAAAGSSWIEGLVPQTLSVIGPDLAVPSLSFVDTSSLDACGLHRLLCPDTTAACYDGVVPCPIDRAAAWLPDPSQSPGVSQPWYWDTAFFEQDSASDTAGATGGYCDVARPTLDATEVAGDGDGYPDAVDCDNEDPGIVPVRPPRDGVATARCEPALGRCWTCPPGTEIDDDDSTTAPPDDDDSSSAPPPPGRPLDTGTDPGPVCSLRGCGVSWSARSLAAFFGGFLWFGLGRRRPPDNDHPTPLPNRTS